ncbi:MAG: prepilin-type N-terminal cleavage/methylation domain-containing protein [Spirochaetes bacterium]|nr:prepilin-type N-terminal cleavage/methylation domain-containing protein [Spirochaetota bacterium]
MKKAFINLHLKKHLRTKASRWNNSSAGFTMMESMVAIAITAIMAGVIFTIISTSFKGANNTMSSIESAYELLFVDRLIREKAETLYVPYWASMEIAADNFSDQLWTSSIAKYIESVKLIYNSERIIRGIEVKYLINNNSYTTLALFSNRPLLGDRW